MTKKIIVLASLVVLVAGLYFSDAERYLSLTYYQSLYEQQPWLTALIYFCAYVLVAALSLPGAAILTLVGGAVFGLAVGFWLVSFASSIGATLAFLISRFLLRDWVQKRFGAYLGAVNRGIEKDGAFYLFSLRLIPVIPFFVINLVMGLMPIRIGVFYLISQLGMVAGTLVYVNAGAELGAVESLSAAGILTPGVVLSLLLLAAFPFVAKMLVGRVQQWRVYRPYQKPARFDTNLVVIGAGSAGLVSAYIAAAVKARVTLIEKHRMGGDCLNTGCVPSKALIRAAKAVKEVRHAEELGVEAGEPRVDFSKVMDRVRQVVATIEPHDSVERYTALGVDCIEGHARIVSPWQVDVDGRTINTRNIVIATGARPFVPPVPGLTEIDYLTSDNLWALDALPERMLVMGGGPIGCELAQAFARLGSQVTLVDMMPRLLPREDEDVSRFIAQRFEQEGVSLMLGYEVSEFESSAGEPVAVLKRGTDTSRVAFDRVLVAVGRRANTDGLGLSEMNVELNNDGTLQVNEYLQTRYPNIVACGDVAGPYQFTHTAAHQAWYAAVNTLFGRFRKFRVDYSVIPWVTFTDPEVAHVGLSEQQAIEQGVSYEVTRYDLGDLDRAIADNSAHGFVKVLTPNGKDKILGATIVGERAGDMLTEFVCAMKQGTGLNKLLGTIHVYPTISEANKFVAGEWKRAHAPKRLLDWAARYHRWQLK
jgi:dihydrolipoamide dehydrogenase